jgi:zinc protease
LHALKSEKSMSKTIPTLVPEGFTFIRSFQGIDEYSLNNGLKVLLFLDPSQANVTVNITYLVGSRHEGQGEAGMAHLLEHMLFRGTKKTRDIKGALQDKGAQFNATTWFDRTNYFETLTPTSENLEFALALEADRMINSLILQEDLDSEMTVVRNEFEMGENNPTHVLHDQLMSSAYLWHNYGKTTIGNRSDIERVPVNKLRKFYENYYQPDNAVLIVAGQFVKDEAIELIRKHFLRIKRPERILDETYTEEPPQDGPREVRLLRVGDMASVAVGYHVPAASHPDHAALKIFFDAVADEPSGVIYQKLVETGISSEVFSMIYSLYEPGMGLVFVRPTEDGAALSVKDDLVELLENAQISKVQVERMKSRALKKIKLSMSNSKELALKLSEAIACGDWRLFFWYKERIDQVTVEDVLRVASSYIIESNRTSGVFLPQSEPKRAVIETAPRLTLALENLKEDESMKNGEAFLPDAQNIEKLTERKTFNTSKVSLLPKKTRGQSVRAQLYLRFGNEEVIKPFEKELWLLPAMLSRGTSKYSYQALRDRVDSLMSNIDIDGHAGVITSSIKSERQHLGSMISLLKEMLLDPSFKDEEFSIVRQREIDNYEEVKSDPQRVGFLELERMKNPWPKDHILYVRSFDETIAALKDIKLENIKKAYQSLFSTQNFCLSVVGDHDQGFLSEIEAMMTKPASR